LKLCGGLDQRLTQTEGKTRYSIKMKLMNEQPGALAANYQL
jgi:hypothetical protein